jgi:hypothetical protein
MTSMLRSADNEPRAFRSSNSERVHPSASCFKGSQRILQKLTIDLIPTFATCNANFSYSHQHNPRRVLTKPCEKRGNDGIDNENCDYILRVHDFLQADTIESYV